mmetsp:Transcript_24337/g.51853  ORF Transcript_24337/g.51853 Transcript_24337/m.51853 type:complete len:81 (-) Transcript_24337:314-556(-)
MQRNRARSMRETTTKGRNLEGGQKNVKRNEIKSVSTSGKRHRERGNSPSEISILYKCQEWGKDFCDGLVFSPPKRRRSRL